MFASDDPEAPVVHVLPGVVGSLQRSERMAAWLRKVMEATDGT